MVDKLETAAGTKKDLTFVMERRNQILKCRKEIGKLQQTCFTTKKQSKIKSQ